MYEPLDLFLQDAVSPEYLETIRDAVEYLERIEDPDYQFRFDEILMLADQHEVCYSVEMFAKWIQGSIDASLAGFGVEMSEEAPLDLKVKILNTLLDIEDAEDKTGIQNICQTEEEAKEIFCELMSFMTTYTVDQLFPDTIQLMYCFSLSIIRHKLT